MLTSKKGSLSDAITKRLHGIEYTASGNVSEARRTTFEKRRDIDGGVTAKTCAKISRGSGKDKTTQSFMHDPSVSLSRDEKAQIVKADHLGIITGVGLQLESPNGELLNYATVNDEVSSLVVNDDTSMVECVTLVNPDEDVPQSFAKILRHEDRNEWLDSVLKEYLNLAFLKGPGE